MSHWTTSGRSRLKARQNNAFAENAIRRARLSGFDDSTIMYGGGGGEVSAHRAGNENENISVNIVPTGSHTKQHADRNAVTAPNIRGYNRRRRDPALRRAIFGNPRRHSNRRYDATETVAHGSIVEKRTNPKRLLDTYHISQSHVPTYVRRMRNLRGATSVKPVAERLSNIPPQAYPRYQQDRRQEMERHPAGYAGTASVNQFYPPPHSVRHYVQEYQQQLPYQPHQQPRQYEHHHHHQYYQYPESVHPHSIQQSVRQNLHPPFAEKRGARSTIFLENNGGSIRSGLVENARSSVNSFDRFQDVGGTPLENYQTYDLPLQDIAPSYDRNPSILNETGGGGLSAFQENMEYKRRGGINNDVITITPSQHHGGHVRPQYSRAIHNDGHSIRSFRHDGTNPSPADFSTQYNNYPSNNSSFHNPPSLYGYQHSEHEPNSNFPPISEGIDTFHDDEASPEFCIHGDEENLNHDELGTPAQAKGIRRFQQQQQQQQQSSAIDANAANLWAGNQTLGRDHPTTRSMFDESTISSKTDFQGVQFFNNGVEVDVEGTPLLNT